METVGCHPRAKKPAPGSFLRTAVRRPVRILTFLATKKAPAFADAFLVETVGFEPMTSRMRTERSTN